MLERDGVRPRKFANQRLITGSDGQGLPMTCSLGCARGSTNGSCRRSLAWHGCKLPRGSDFVSLRYRTFVPTSKDSAGRTVHINPSFSHCVPSRRQPTPNGRFGPVCPRPSPEKWARLDSVAGQGG